MTHTFSYTCTYNRCHFYELFISLWMKNVFCSNTIWCVHGQKKLNQIKENSQTNQKSQLHPNGESIMNLNLELMRVVFMYGKSTANDATHVSWKQEWWINFQSRIFYVTIASVQVYTQTRTKHTYERIRTFFLKIYSFWSPCAMCIV